MTIPPLRQCSPNIATSYYWSGEVIRSRSVSEHVLTGALDVPSPPARLVADWHRETVLRLGLEPGDVDSLSLPRARMRWPDYPRCLQAMTDWTNSLGLSDVLAFSEVALMTCRGARYHHDGAQYGAAAFCNLFLSEDKGLDLHFASTGHRIPLVRGTAVVFDTGQPHAVIARHSCGFDIADFTGEQEGTLVFLTWELPIENVHVARTLQIDFDTQCETALHLTDEQLHVDGAIANLCPQTGRWMPSA